MNELREKIARIVYDYRYIAPERVESVDYEADKILALVDAQPSGLVVERKCERCYGGDISPDGLGITHNKCPSCVNGTITRDLSVKKALEWARGIAKTYEKLHDEKLDAFAYLPSGERVICKQKS